MKFLWFSASKCYTLVVENQVRLLGGRYIWKYTGRSFCRTNCRTQNPGRYLNMEKIKKMLPYLIADGIAFYLLPLMIIDTGSGMFILLLCIPLMCFIISFSYGVRNAFSWIYSLLVALLFVPSIFIFYNESATIYIAAYGIISVIGNFFGKLFYTKR